MHFLLINQRICIKLHIIESYVGKRVYIFIS